LWGPRIGYVRVSGCNQNTERQFKHIWMDKVFLDKASGKETCSRCAGDTYWRATWRLCAPDKS